MTFRVVHKPSNNHVRCPSRLSARATAAAGTAPATCHAVAIVASSADPGAARRQPDGDPARLATDVVRVRGRQDVTESCSSRRQATAAANTGSAASRGHSCPWRRSRHDTPPAQRAELPAPGRCCGSPCAARPPRAE